MNDTLIALLALFLGLGCGKAKVDKKTENKDKTIHENTISLKTKAEKGDARAQARLGFLYKKGQGVEKDLKEAAKWYR